MLIHHLSIHQKQIIKRCCAYFAHIIQTVLQPPDSIQSMQTNKYKSIWIAFVQFKAEAGESFNDLINTEGQGSDLVYLGAWANVLIDSTNMNDALDIIEHGLRELKSQLIFIQKIENTALLVEEEELKSSVVDEISYMLKHGYKFMISDRIFPYADGEE